MYDLFSNWRTHLTSLYEGVCRLKNSLQIAREQLPQIDESDVSKFLFHLKRKRIPVFKDKVVVSELIPAQSHLNLDKVKNLTREGEDNLCNKPIFISKDNEILDGHHRWYALKMLNKEAVMPVWRMDLNFVRCIEEMKSFSETYSKSVEDY